ncbi:MAG: amidase [Erythrobacter sp.]|uniref:amidase n=1 Tax=Erythrobacter sp. TaxID=1042 RepID=UPI0026238A59|nr:amidase [Erythrobacter sp.]MDJ0978906.1 amidase [Erythrobacter sp.]
MTTLYSAARPLTLALAASLCALAAPPAERALAQDPEAPAFDAEADIAMRVAQIERYDNGPDGLNAVIVHSQTAGFKAREAAGTGPLNGRSVLVKDNIETEEWATTAGSLALQYNFTRRDAPMIANLRKAGGVVLGKANLSEWANIRGDNSTSGWSAIGGLTRNPHATDRNTCGSSSGSGAAVAAGMAWGAIGTETNGSITCPASINGVVGFKPSVGIVSRTHVIPISSTQDTAGPMTQTVYDAALLLSAIAGEDEADAATVGVPRVADYTEGLSAFSLEGVRIGVMVNQLGNREDLKAVFAQARADLEAAGAALVDIEHDTNREMYRDSFTVLKFELREEMGKYLRSIPEMQGAPTPRSLADLIAFNKANSDRELRWFGQETFIEAEAETDREAYEKARENAVRLAGEETLDAIMAEHKVAFLIAPTRGPAWVSDLVNGDSFNGSIGFGSPAAIAGYPHLTVPMGAIEGLPVGLSFFGAKWADHEVLKVGAAYEKARTAKLPAPSFEPWSAER